ncbi:MAG: flagellar hook basal-body protein [Planctomycetota bacterium]|nr:MAG: flagellar hook basal-body protein [Planctomycetota bacterium]
MIDGILQGAATMDAAATRLDLAAANLANAATPGYKRRMPVLHSFAAALAAQRAQGERGAPLVRADVARDDSPGLGERTGNPLDVLLEGDGWLAVQTDRGERYTRAGALAVAPDGTLVTRDGDPVLGEGGPLRLQPDGGPPEIDRSGVVRQGQNELGKLRIVRFDAGARLEPEGGGRMRLAEGKPQPDPNTRVLQGHLERSNVDPVLELVDMIKALRLFEAAANTIKTQDRTLSALTRAI